jgi:hypothetical protein
MKYNACAKEKTVEKDVWCRQTFQTGCKKYISHTFGLLSSIHNLHTSWILFDLDQKSNICRDIQKIEGLIIHCVPIPQNTYQITKRLKTSEKVEKYFPSFLASIILQNNRYQDLSIGKERRISTQIRRKDILLKINLL